MIIYSKCQNIECIENWAGKKRALSILTFWGCVILIFRNSIRIFEWSLIGSNALFAYKAIFSAPLSFFILLGGSFFLDPNIRITAKQIWSRCIPILVSSYLVWSVIYAYQRLIVYATHTSITLKVLIIEAFNVPAHLTYLPVFVGMLIFTPILREVTRSNNQKMFKYIFVIFVCALFLNSIMQVAHLPFYGTFVRTIIPKTPVYYICQYMVLYLIGYILCVYEFRKATIKFILILGFISAPAMYFINKWQLAEYGEELVISLEGDFTLTSFFKWAALIILIREICKNYSESEKNKKMMHFVFKATPTVFLCHVLIMEILNYFDFQIWDNSPYFSIAAYAVITIIISYAFAFIWVEIKKITKAFIVQRIPLTNTDFMASTLNDSSIITEPVQFGQGERDYSVDIMRIFSCFMVILVHCTAFFLPFRYNVTPEGTPLFYLMFFYRALFASPTVLFVMVSGIFFLTPTRNVTAKKIWTKNIPKLACAYVFWCYLYGLVSLLNEPETVITFKSLSLEALDQPTHLWYIPMIIGVYVFAPVIREITKAGNTKVFRYVIGVFIGAVIFYSIANIPHYPYYETYIRSILTKIPYGYFCQFIIWFLIGYILYSYRMPHKVRRLFYVLGIASVLVSFLVNVWQYIEYSMDKGKVLQTKFTVTTFFKNTAIFLFFTTNLRKVKLSNRAKKIISKVSGTTLIVYLMHWMILKFMFEAELLQQYINPGMLVFIYSIITFTIGCLVSLAFQAVPWKKIKRLFRKEEQV